MHQEGNEELHVTLVLRGHCEDHKNWANKALRRVSSINFTCHDNFECHKNNGLFRKPKTLKLHSAGLAKFHIVFRSMVPWNTFACQVLRIC